MKDARLSRARISKKKSYPPCWVKRGAFVKGRCNLLCRGRVALAVCFFSTVTLHDDIARLPGMQKSLAMAHFVDDKWAFYDFLSLGLFDKNFIFETGEEIWHKICKKGCYFRFSIEYFFLRKLYYLNRLSKNCQVGLKLKLIETSFKNNKNRSTKLW